MKDSLYSYPKKNRLLSRHAFQSVFSASHKITRKYLIIRYQSNQLGLARLGVIIAKRFAKAAVTRNTFKRIVRERFRQHKESLKGLDIVVQVRSEWSPAGKQALPDDLDQLWQVLTSSKKV